MKINIVMKSSMEMNMVKRELKNSRMKKNRMNMMCAGSSSREVMILMKCLILLIKPLPDGIDFRSIGLVIVVVSRVTKS